jgi:outer membrane protein assembly factor BamB
MKMINSFLIRVKREQRKKPLSFSIPFVAWIFLLFTLLDSCKDKDEEKLDNAPAAGNVTEIKGLKDDSRLNRFLLTSKDGMIVKVDANTGTHQEIFKFADFDDVESIDLVDGVIYAGAGDNSINAIDLESKKLLWDVPLLKYESSSLADPDVVVKDGVAYAAGISGVLTAVDIHTAKVLWTYPLNPSGATDEYYSQAGKPTVTDDAIIIGSSRSSLENVERNYLHAIEKKTGKRIWRKELPEGFGVSGSIKVAGNVLLVPARSLFALDFNTGQVLWEFKMEKLSRGAGSPSIMGDKVLVQGASAVAEGKLYCLYLNSGQKIWEIEAGNDYAGIYSPLVVEGFVFGVYEKGSSEQGFGNGRPFLAEVNSGKIIWKNEDISVKSSPVLANGRLFFHGTNYAIKGSIDNQVGLLCLEAASGKFVWLNNYFRYSSTTTPIVVAENGIFRSGAF